MHRLFNQPIEEFAAELRASPIETECELIEVISQMLGTDRALMCSQYPSFEQTGNQMTVWEKILSKFGTFTHNLAPSIPANTTGCIRLSQVDTHLNFLMFCKGKNKTSRFFLSGIR